jgi:hypothetical protein
MESVLGQLKTDIYIYIYPSELILSVHIKYVLFLLKAGDNCSESGVSVKPIRAISHISNPTDVYFLVFRRAFTINQFIFLCC